MPQKHTFTAAIQDAGGGGASKVEADAEERVATVPAELKRAFKSDKESKSAFEKLAYTHQKEYVTWINEARQAETREGRITRTIKRLQSGGK